MQPKEQLCIFSNSKVGVMLGLHKNGCVFNNTRKFMCPGYRHFLDSLYAILLNVSYCDKCVQTIRRSEVTFDSDGYCHYHGRAASYIDASSNDIAMCVDDDSLIFLFLYFDNCIVMPIGYLLYVYTLISMYDTVSHLGRMMSCVSYFEALNSMEELTGLSRAAIYNTIEDRDIGNAFVQDIPSGFGSKSFCDLAFFDDKVSFRAYYNTRELLNNNVCSNLTQCLPLMATNMALTWKQKSVIQISPWIRSIGNYMSFRMASYLYD